MKIFTKVPDFTGIRATVMFVNGQGDTDDPALIEWFRSHGYTIGDGKNDPEVKGERDQYHLAEAKLEELKANPTVEFPHFPSMSVDEIRAWAKANKLGSKIGALKNKDKLIAVLTN